MKKRYFLGALIVFLTGIGAFALLQVLGIELGPRPMPGPQTETVKLVLYHDDGYFDVKRVGDWILIDTGEIVQVKRNRIRPDRQHTAGYQEFSLAKKAPAKSGTLPILLDRQTGVACLGASAPGSTEYAHISQKSPMVKSAQLFQIVNSSNLSFASIATTRTPVIATNWQ